MNDGSLVTLENSGLYYNLGYIGGAIYLQHSAGTFAFNNNQFGANVVRKVLFPDGSIGSDSSGAALGWNCYSTSKIKSKQNLFYRNLANSGILGGISATFSDFNSTFESFIFEKFFDDLNFTKTIMPFQLVQCTSKDILSQTLLQQCLSMKPR